MADTAIGYVRSSSQIRDEDEQRRLLKDANELGNSLYRLLAEMEGVGTDDLPYPVVAPMQRWIESLGFQNVTFFRALSVANYELKRFTLDDYIGIRAPSPSLAKIVADEKSWPYLRITVPGKARSTLPHFAIVAHEVGHIVHATTNPTFGYEPGALQKFSENVIKKLGVTSLEEDTKDFFAQAANFWASELFADAFGICLLGPAFFFALGAFIESLGPAYVLSTTHPPAVVRRRVAFRKLERGIDFSFLKTFEAVTSVKLSENINSSLLDNAGNPDDLIEKLVAKRLTKPQAIVLCFLPDLVETLADRIYETVDAHIRAIDPAMLYTSHQLKGDLETHLDELVEAVPPIESGVRLSERKETELSTILNVGWAAMLTRLDQVKVARPSSDLASAERAEQLHLLLIKAVELSEARRTWRNA